MKIHHITLFLKNAFLKVFLTLALNQINVSLVTSRVSREDNLVLIFFCHQMDDCMLSSVYMQAFETVITPASLCHYAKQMMQPGTQTHLVVILHAVNII